jgi:hypothetical protein
MRELSMWGACFARSSGARPARPTRGEFTPAEFIAAEDRAVRDVVAMQEELGLLVVNDGEMRREFFQSELTAACDGFTGVDVNAWLRGEWHSSGWVLSRLRGRRAGGYRAVAQAPQPCRGGVLVLARLHQPAGEDAEPGRPLDRIADSARVRFLPKRVAGGARLPRYAPGWALRGQALAMVPRSA